MNVMVRMLVLGGGLAAASAILFGVLERSGSDQGSGSKATSGPRVTCFSGVNVILDDFAAGDVDISESGAYRFRSRTTGQRIRIFGDCVAVYAAAPKAGFKPVLP